jgi:hypothetical protein
MSARKLSRFAGLVFVLAAIIGGVAAVNAGVQHGTRDSATTAATAASQNGPIDIVWL